MKDAFQPLSSEAQWHSLLNEAQAKSHRQLSEMLEHYLVVLLMRFTRRAESLCQAVAPGYLEAMTAEGQQRPRELRDVGDTCLLLAGLFPGRANALAVKSDYYIGLGQSAYGEASTHLDTEDHPLFLTLAQRFVSAMDVLMAIRLLNESTTMLPDALTAHDLHRTYGSRSAHSALSHHCEQESCVIVSPSSVFAMRSASPVDQGVD